MIDVIIPTYKPDDYFLECLISIQSQTLSFDSFKVTIILNGDKEPYYSNIEAMLRDFSFNYSFVYTEEKGVSNARNLGLEKTNNPYIFFLDDDDLLTENYLEKLLLQVEQNSIIVSNVLGFSGNLENTSKDYLSFDNSFQSSNLTKYRKYLSNSCCKLIPRNIIGDTIFDISLFKGEDALFMFTLSPRIVKIVSTGSDVIYFRRIRPFSASRTKYSLFREIEIGIQQQFRYSKVFFINFGNYNFILYITRMLAVVKVFLMKIKR